MQTVPSYQKQSIDHSTTPQCRALGRLLSSKEHIGTLFQRNGVPTTYIGWPTTPVTPAPGDLMPPWHMHLFAFLIYTGLENNKNIS